MAWPADRIKTFGPMEQISGADFLNPLQDYARELEQTFDGEHYPPGDDHEGQHFHIHAEEIQLAETAEGASPWRSLVSSGHHTLLGPADKKSYEYRGEDCVREVDEDGNEKIIGDFGYRAVRTSTERVPWASLVAEAADGVATPDWKIANNFWYWVPLTSDGNLLLAPLRVPGTASLKSAGFRVDIPVQPVYNPTTVAVRIRKRAGDTVTQLGETVRISVAEEAATTVWIDVTLEDAVASGEDVEFWADVWVNAGDAVLGDHHVTGARRTIETTFLSP